MTFFDEFKVEYDYFSPNDSDVTKISTYDFSSADFRISLNVIRISAVDSLIEGEPFGEYRANLDDVINGDSVDEGGVFRSVSDNNVMFQVVDKPRYNKIFNRYKLNLKPYKGIEK